MLADSTAGVRRTTGTRGLLLHHHHIPVDPGRAAAQLHELAERPADETRVSRRRALVIGAPLRARHHLAGVQVVLRGVPRADQTTVTVHSPLAEVRQLMAATRGHRLVLAVPVGDGPPSGTSDTADGYVGGRDPGILGHADLLRTLGAAALPRFDVAI